WAHARHSVNSCKWCGGHLPLSAEHAPNIRRAHAAREKAFSKSTPISGLHTHNRYCGVWHRMSTQCTKVIVHERGPRSSRRAACTGQETLQPRFVSRYIIQLDWPDG
ncbi:hypothetical protein PanWU01x14_363780, partial [Parasponia andersonii]